MLPSLKLLGIIIAGDNGVSMAFFPSVSKAFTTRKKGKYVLTCFYNLVH